MRLILKKMPCNLFGDVSLGKCNVKSKGGREMETEQKRT